jgi:hypothetical protein
MEQKKVENSGEKARDILPKKIHRTSSSHPYLYLFLKQELMNNQF